MENLLRVGMGHRAQQDLQQSAGKISRFVTRVKDFERFQKREKSVARSPRVSPPAMNDRTETMHLPRIVRVPAPGRGAPRAAARAHPGTRAPNFSATVALKCRKYSVRMRLSRGPCGDT